MVWNIGLGELRGASESKANMRIPSLPNRYAECYHNILTERSEEYYQIFLWKAVRSTTLTAVRITELEDLRISQIRSERLTFSSISQYAVGSATYMTILKTRKLCD